MPIIALEEDNGALEKLNIRELAKYVSTYKRDVSASPPRRIDLLATYDLGPSSPRLKPRVGSKATFKRLEPVCTRLRVEIPVCLPAWHPSFSGPYGRKGAEARSSRAGAEGLGFTSA